VLGEAVDRRASRRRARTPARCAAAVPGREVRCGEPEGAGEVDDAVPASRSCGCELEGDLVGRTEHDDVGGGQLVDVDGLEDRSPPAAAGMFGAIAAQGRAALDAPARSRDVEAGMTGEQPQQLRPAVPGRTDDRRCSAWQTSVTPDGADAEVCTIMRKSANE
jgi:hypothetical protein